MMVQAVEVRELKRLHISGRQCSMEAANLTVGILDNTLHKHIAQNPRSDLPVPHLFTQFAPCCQQLFLLESILYPQY
jgi:hypothetical protein